MQGERRDSQETGPRRVPDQGYQLRSNAHHPNANANASGRNFNLITSSYYNDSREPSPYRAHHNQRSRGHYGKISQPASTYRDASKNSRSSAAKSIRGNYGLQSPVLRARGETQQISGISSKL
jgi:hypothetical protein